MLKIGSIVRRAESESSRFGVITEFFDHGRRKLASVHYIDPNTGKLLQCPDKARCGNTGHTCPIHGFNTDKHALEAFSNRDVAFYVDEGLICARLARKHAAPVIRISRKKGHAFYIETLEEGFSTRKVITDPTQGEEWQTALALCNPLPYGTSALLTDPDNKDYKTFARLFRNHALGGIL